MDINLLKKLRDETNAGVGLCKEALEKNNDDYEAALKYVEEKAAEKISKKEGCSTKAGTFDVYVHGQDRNIAVIVEAETQTDFVARNEELRKFIHEVSLQVAAMNPQYVDREEISEEEMKDIEEQYAKGDDLKDKPKGIQEKIIKGKIEKHLKEVCLMEQPYFRDTDKTMAELIKEAISKFGENIKITRFIRWQR